MNKPECNHTISTEELTGDSPLREWLQAQARQHNLKYLLGHADDGVIWGYFNDSFELTTADQVFQKPKHDLPSLRLLTLQQCRLFGNTSEVMLWRINEAWQTKQEWKARFINDEKLVEEDYILEDQILWGTQSEETSDNFTLVSDGSQGLRHAIPLTQIPFNKPDKLHRPLRLSVRHYIHYDEDGLARIYLSRLVDLTTSKN